MSTLRQEQIADLCGLTARRIRELAAAGAIPKPDRGAYPAAETLRALFVHFRKQTKTSLDPLRREQIRATRAKADRQEREEKQAAGLLVPFEDVRRMYGAALMPIRQRLLALPAECATRANPTDPQFARDALQRWVDESLPLIRDALQAKPIA